MERISDTPPDGDFARYVEQLSAKSAAAVAARDVDGKFAATGGSVPKAVAPLMPAGPLAVRKGLSVWAVVRWALVAWVALQVVTVFVPRASVLSLPLFLALAGWALYRFKKASSGAMGYALRRMAEQAAKEFKQGK